MFLLCRTQDSHERDYNVHQQSTYLHTRSFEIARSVELILLFIIGRLVMWLVLPCLVFIQLHGCTRRWVLKFQVHHALSGMWQGTHRRQSTQRFPRRVGSSSKRGHCKIVCPDGKVPYFLPKDNIPEKHGTIS